MIRRRSAGILASAALHLACRARRAWRDRRRHWPRRRPCRRDRPRPARRGYWRHRSWRWRPTARHADRCRARHRRRPSAIRRGLTPLVATTTGALVPDALTSRVDPALEAEPVDEHDLAPRRASWRRPASADRHGRRRSGRPALVDLDAVAADILHEIAEDREGRDDLRTVLVLRAMPARCTQRQASAAPRECMRRLSIDGLHVRLPDDAPERAAAAGRRRGRTAATAHRARPRPG